MSNTSLLLCQTSDRTGHGVRPTLALPTKPSQASSTQARANDSDSSLSDANDIPVIPLRRGNAARANLSVPPPTTCRSTAAPVSQFEQLSHAALTAIKPGLPEVYALVGSTYFFSISQLFH